MSRRLLFALVVACGCGGAARVRPVGVDYLEAIRVEGNRAIPDDALAPALALHETRRDGASVDPYLLAADTERIRVAYWKRGFFAAHVAARVERTDHAQTVVFTVVEGRRAATRVEITGLPPELPLARARALVGLSDGDPFDYATYDAAKLALKTALENAGYARAEVPGTVDADPAAATATVRYAVAAGELARFGELRIAGTVRPQLVDAVRGRLAFAPGDRYSLSALEQSQLSITELGRFSTVQLEPDRNRTGPVGIAAQLAEASRHEVHGGGGLGYDQATAEVRVRGGFSFVPPSQPLLTVSTDIRAAETYDFTTKAFEPKVRLLATLQRLDLFRPHVREPLPGRRRRHADAAGARPVQPVLGGRRRPVEQGRRRPQDPGRPGIPDQPPGVRSARRDLVARLLQRQPRRRGELLMRSALRWLARLGLGLVLLAAVVVALLLLTAHTGWGREQLRSRVEAALRDTFPGGARVGALEGSLLGSLTLRDVELDRPDGVRMVAIAELRVDLALWPLASHTARIHALVADGVRVAILPSATAPGASEAAPSPWRIELERVAIARASLDVAAGGTAIALSDLAAMGSGTVEHGVVTLFVWSHARWPQRDAELTATSAIVLDRVVRLPVAHVAVGGSIVSATGVVIDPGAGGARFPLEQGAAAVIASGGALASLVPELGMRPSVADALGTIVATAEVRAPHTAARDSSWETRLEVRAHSAAGRLWASLHGDLARRIARGVISVDGIDLAPITDGRWCGRGAAIAALDGERGAGGDRLRGTAIVDADVLGALRELDRLRGEPAARCSAAPSAGPAAPEAEAAQAAVVALDATWDRATVAVLAGDDKTPHAFAVGSVQRRGDAFVLDDAHAAARTDAVTAGSQRVTGPLVATATATGTLAPALYVRVAGNAAGRRLATADVAIAAVEGAFELRVKPASVLGEARVAARGIRVGGAQIASIRADIANRADGSLRIAATARPDASGLELFTDASVMPSGRRIVLARSRVVLPGGMAWAGNGGSVEIEPQQIDVHGVTLHSSDGSVAIGGTFSRAAGALVAHLTSPRLAELQIHDRYRGMASGTLDLARRRGVWTAQGRLQLRGTTLPIDLAASFALDGRRAMVDARATGAVLGSAALTLEATAPRDPFDLRAWQALDRRAIRSAAFTARKLELSQVAALVAPPGSIDLGAPLHGTVDGAVQLASGALSGGLAVRELAVPLAVLDGDLAFTGGGADASVQATARLADLGSAELAARFALPDRPFAAATWRRGGRDLLLGASAAITGVGFDRERLDRLGISKLLAAHGLDGDYRGRMSAALTLDAAAADAQLALDIDDLAGGALVEPVSPRIAITAGSNGSHLHATAVAGARAQAEGALSLGELEGDLAMTLDRWLEDPAAGLRAPLRAAWTLPATPAVPLLALLGRRELASGTLDAKATVGGTLSAPVVAAHLGARDIAVATRLEGRASPVLRELDADASWEDGNATLEVRGRESAGGELRASARGRLDALAGATASLTVRHFELAPLAVVATSAVPQLPAALVSASGTLDADLTVASARLGGTLTLTGGSLPIGATIGTLRDARATVSIDDRAIHAAVRGRLGRGTIDLTANAAGDLATIDARLRLAGVSPITALRPIIDADIDARLRLGDDQPCSPGAAAARVCGKIEIASARITLPDHPSTPLLDVQAPADLRFVAAAPAGSAAAAPPRSAPAASPSQRPWLIASVTLDSTPVIAEDVAEGVSFHASVHSDGLALTVGDALGLRGSVEIDHADADILGRRYAVEPSALTFAGTADPQIDIRMSHQFPDLALDVAILGSASTPDLRLSSEPGGYTYDQLFGFLLGGEPGGEPGSQTRDAVTAGGARWLSGKLGRRISKVLPVKLDAISCEPATSASAVAGGSCTFGKWFSERLFVAYRQHLGGTTDENTGDIQVQYRMGRKVLIEGSGGDRGHIGADLLYRHRW
ncbi:MAG TPA: translocation/assembly module TamB domain-containing protein [Kofleriaceae bacterium]|nr:translocation/assembly module TamB domain-containing protein [Kofleriaceae bacterium]